ncbi:MAG: ribosome biogenesis GTP-binding protein YihA/YsxC [Pseudomonadota bacterium]
MQQFPRDWYFERPVDAVADLPATDMVEIAFAGRSNVGKSSLINALCRKEKLARTSNTPGRTQSLNLFASASGIRIIDMPGYGFARAPKAKVEGWTRLIHTYLLGRPCLRMTYVLIDSRHGLKGNDFGLMSELDVAAVAYKIVLTKADKIPLAACNDLCEKMHAALKPHAACAPTVITTSTKTREGVQDLRDHIMGLLL